MQSSAKITLPNQEHVFFAHRGEPSNVLAIFAQCAANNTLSEQGLNNAFINQFKEELHAIASTKVKTGRSAEQAAEFDWEYTIDPSGKIAITCREEWYHGANPASPYISLDAIPQNKRKAAKDRITESIQKLKKHSITLLNNKPAELFYS